MLVFTSLTVALQQGFQVWDRTATGYLVRKKIGKEWALALVELTNYPQA